MSDETLRGWRKFRKTQKTTQQIPIDVAVVAHFQNRLEACNSFFAASICANQWISMAGMILEAHIQRSYLIRETNHAYVFLCVEGKNKGKPFPWVLPKETLGEDDGYQSSAKMIASLRSSFNENEDPFLMAQFGCCTTDPSPRPRGALPPCHRSKWPEPEKPSCAPLL